MPISDVTLRNAKPGAKPRKIAAGHGLYLEVMPTGSKLWRMKYRHNGKENRLSFGPFSEVGFKEARERCAEARALLRQGIDPAAKRNAEKRAGTEASANGFETIAREWLAVKSPEWVEETAKRITAWLENDVFPFIGRRAISELEYDAPALLDVLQRMTKRGSVDSAHRVRDYMGNVFRFAIATGRAKHDPAADLRDALPKAQGKNFAALIKPDEIAGRLGSDGCINARLEQFLHASLANGTAKAPDLRGIARQARLVKAHAAEILPDHVFGPALDQFFVAEFVGMLEVTHTDLVDMYMHGFTSSQCVTQDSFSYQ
jgi:hypothetical protein